MTLLQKIARQILGPKLEPCPYHYSELAIGRTFKDCPECGWSATEKVDPEIK